MAEPLSVANQVLKKLADQLECSICLESFTDPKLLQCFHVFCKDCLEPLVLQDEHGQSLRCPNCRRSTLLPANSVSGLQPAFHVHHLFEIQDALQKVKQGQEGQKTQCEKCKKREAIGFCRDCGKFVCEACIEVHQTWEDFATHKVISLEQLESNATEMVPPTRKTLCCSKHPGKELDLFCETDQELICQHCIVKMHRDHQYDLVSEAFPKHRDTINAHLEIIKQQLITVNKTIQGLDATKGDILNQQAAVEANILMKIKQLHEALEVRRSELTSQLDQMTRQKLKTLAIQRDELQLIQTRLNSCIKYVSDSLKTGSEGEILAMEKPVVQQVKGICEEFDPDRLPHLEQADMTFTVRTELLTSCQQFGKICNSQVCPEKCYITGQGRKSARVGEQSTVTVHMMDMQGTKYTESLPLSSIFCELVPYSTTGKKGNVTLSVDSELTIDYLPSCRGRHQLHIKVSDQHIRASPLTIVVRGEVNTPVMTINGLNMPWGVAIDERGQIIIAESWEHCISVYSPTGEKVKSLGGRGSTPGRFNHPCGVTVDNAGNILVADSRNHCIQKFTAGGKFVAAVGIKGDKSGCFNDPPGVRVGPSGKVYVCDNLNHRVQILNPDLSYSASFGNKGCSDGKFNSPWDVAFDSLGNTYVADHGNHRIQVFTEECHFLRQFGKRGSGDGELNRPTSVEIDSDDVVYVAERDNHRISLFTNEGLFLKSFGTQGEGPGQFNQPHGVRLNKDGLVYVSDYGNQRLQVW